MTERIRSQDITRTEEAIRNFNDAEMALTRAQQELEPARHGVLKQLGQLRETAPAENDPGLIGVLRHLYWQQVGIGSRDLQQPPASPVPMLWLAALGSCPSGIPCSICGVDLPRTSRSWQPKTYGSSGPLCEGCSSRRQEAMSRVWRVRDMRARLIGSTPVGASVRDWNAAATLVLAYPPVTMGVQRGSEDDLQLGTWSGWEHAKAARDELIRSGASDDDHFELPAATAQKLISSAFEAAGWDTERTRDLVDPITMESAHGLLTRLNQTVHNVVRSAKERADKVYPDDYEPTREEVRSTWEPGPVWRD